MQSKEIESENQTEQDEDGREQRAPPLKKDVGSAPPRRRPFVMCLWRHGMFHRPLLPATADCRYGDSFFGVVIRS